MAQQSEPINCLVQSPLQKSVRMFRGDGTPMFRFRRKFRAEGVKGKARDTVLAKTMAAADRKIRFMRCREHGEAPVVTASGDSFSVSTCCEEFKKRVLETLAEH